VHNNMKSTHTRQKHHGRWRPYCDQRTTNKFVEVIRINYRTDLFVLAESAGNAITVSFSSGRFSPRLSSPFLALNESQCRNILKFQRTMSRRCIQIIDSFKEHVFFHAIDNGPIVATLSIGGTKLVAL
jgi:hypothetical protein